MGTAMEQQNSRMKAGANPSSENRKTSLIGHYVAQLAMAMGQVIPAERVLLYVRALSDLTEPQLAFGFECALKYFKQEFGRMFPMPADIREWALRWQPEAITDSRRILDRGDKPADWVSKDDAKAFIESLRKPN